MGVMAGIHPPTFFPTPRRHHQQQPTELRQHFEDLKQTYLLMQGVTRTMRGQQNTGACVCVGMDVCVDAMSVGSTTQVRACVRVVVCVVWRCGWVYIRSTVPPPPNTKHI
jgi:hypothetical protein